MKRKRQTAVDIVTMMASRAIFAFLVISGLVLYAEYEWMMR